MVCFFWLGIICLKVMLFRNELFQIMNRRKPFHFEWIDDLRQMRDLAEVLLWVIGTDSRAESMLDWLIEVKTPSFHSESLPYDCGRESVKMEEK